jgi:hypothetical protein
MSDTTKQIITAVIRTLRFLAGLLDKVLKGEPV